MDLGLLLPRQVAGGGAAPWRGRASRRCRTSASCQSKCVDRDRSCSSGDGPLAKRPPQSEPSLVVPVRVRHQSVPNSIAAASRALSSSDSERRGVVGDPVVAAGLDGTEQRAVLDQHLALVERLGGVQLELGPRVGDVEVAHRELADAVGGTERGVVGALHRQLVGVVGERRAAGAEDRVVLAAAQPQGDLAGDERGDPALDRLADHQRLRVEPPTLVEQPAELAALVVVLRDGVLVVDRVDEPLVGDEQQRHRRAPRRCRATWPR